jgi:hypothetical protein
MLNIAELNIYLYKKKHVLVVGYMHAFLVGVKELIIYCLKCRRY